MDKRIYLGALIVIAVLIFVYTMRMSQSNYETSTPAQGNSSNATVEKISEAELSKHNSKNDCWVSYKDKVYDITSFLPKHPGTSAAIEPYCGTSSDFEQAFTKQHGTSKVGMLMKVGVFIGDFNVMGSLK